MNKTELTCIRCPIGCPITVTRQADGTLEITGNSCPRGREYAEHEVTNPVRTVTSTVRVEGGVLPVVPVKTAPDVPKEKMMDCMAAIAGITVRAPVRLGAVLAENLVGTGARLVATREVRENA